MNSKRVLVFCLTVFLIVLSAIFAPMASAKTLGERIGVAHAAGNYSFTSKPFLIEGAEAIRAMGSKVIKVFLDPAKYPYNSQWPDCPNLVDVLSTQYFSDLFAMDFFEKFVLQAHWNTADKSEWIDGVDGQEWAEIEKNYYDAAKYLLSTYSRTNKTFFLEHWEADYFVNGTPPEFDRLEGLSELQKQIAYKGFLNYLAARHSGVEKARREIPNSGAKVFSAVEVACISKYPEIFRLIDHMDEVKADYVSYSMYECGVSLPLLFDNISKLKRALNGRPFYIGEMMRQESEYKAYPDRHAQTMLALLNAVLKEDAEFAILWQIFDNEPAGSSSMDTDEGFGLIRRNGSKMPLYTDLQSISSEALIPEDYFVTPSDFQKLGDVTNWLEVDVDKDGDRYKELPASEIEAERYAVARGAGISNLRGDVSLPLGWKFDGKAPQISLWIPDESGPMPGVLLKYNKQVTKPLADPAGGRYTAVQNVELTSATEGAAIYYSTNGSDPRTNGIVYTGKISVTMGTTLRAYASLDGCADSDVMSEIYLEDDDVPTYYTITFNLMGGDGSVPSQRILSGGTVTSPPDPTLTGYYFAGWYSDSAFTTLWDFNTVVTGNMTLYARWTQDSYTVTFNSNLGSGVPSQSIPSGGTVTRPANPTYSGYEFDDWYRDSALTTRWDFDTVVTGDMTLYAGWLDDDQPNYGGGGGGCSAYAFSSMGVLMVLAAGTLLKKSKKAR